MSLIMFLLKITFVLLCNLTYYQTNIFLYIRLYAASYIYT